MVIGRHSWKPDAGHPDAELLAEYADGLLSGAARAQLEEHLAACDDCRTVVMNATALALEDRTPTHRRSGEPNVVGLGARRRWVGVGAALAAAAVLILAVPLIAPDWLADSLGNRGALGRPELRDLITAVAAEPTRLVAGRLSGFPYAPPPSVSRTGASQSVSPQIKIAAATIEDLAQRQSNPTRLASLGLAYLAVGDLDRAVTTLEDASNAVADAQVHSDLSAVLIARGGRRKEDLPRALAAAERAVHSATPPIEAWFNRALALELLGLRSQAAKAWQDYLDRDPNSPWADEARQRLAALSKVGASRGRLADQIAALDPSDADAIVALARDNRQQVREYLEDSWLALWAEQHAAKSPKADSMLHVAMDLASELSTLTGDDLLVDTVRAITASVPSSSTRAAMAAGLRDYAAGRRAYSAFRYSDARPSFERARQSLASVASPFRVWPNIYLAILTYQDRRLAAAEAQLLAIRDGGYPTARARIHWMLGLIHNETGSYDLALADHGSALELYEALGEQLNASSIENLLAEAYRQLGEPDRAWRYRLNALSRLEATPTSRIRASLLLSAARSARDDGAPLAALHFDAEAVDAVRGDAPVACAQVQVRLAASLREATSHAAARTALADAERCLEQVVDTPVRARLLSETLTEFALQQASAKPEIALAALDDAINKVETLQLTTQASRLLLERGRIARRLGQLDAAARDFENGIAVFERVRLRSLDESLRVSYFDESWQLFDELVDLQARDVGDPIAALDTAERGRLGSAIAATGANLVAPAAIDSLRALAGDVVVLYYTTLRDRLGIWVLTSTSQRFVQRSVGVSALEVLTARFQREIDSETDPTAPGSAAAALFDETIRPVAPLIPTGARLMIVPDGPLHRTIFAGLFDATARQFLLERHSITISTSLSAPLRQGKRTAQRAGLGLIAIAPSVPSDAPPLPHAAEEARTIAGLVPGSTLMTGDGATAAAALAAMPRYRIVHFAGHAVANPEYPGLSRLLFTSPPGSSAPGMVTADRIARLDLDGTELVVLAACSTAAGRISRGQGALSLARPFLTAGARAVVASLWDVDDFAARRLFEGFYPRLLHGSDAAQALRATQIDMLRSRDSRLRGLRAWGAFAVIGRPTASQEVTVTLSAANPQGLSVYRAEAVREER
jgi:CHAT domain-containing protein